MTDTEPTKIRDRNVVHLSSCALHNGPAEIPEPCDCGADPTMTPEVYGSEFPLWIMGTDEAAEYLYAKLNYFSGLPCDLHIPVLQAVLLAQREAGHVEEREKYKALVEAGDQLSIILNEWSNHNDMMTEESVRSWVYAYRQARKNLK